MRTVKSASDGSPLVKPIKATTLTRTGTTATFTATKAHGLVSGQQVNIKGANLEAFNTPKSAPAVVTVTSSTVFTYTIPVDPGADASVTNVIAYFQPQSKEYDPYSTINRNTNRLQMEPMGAAMGEFGFDLINDTTNRTTKQYGVLLPITDVVVAGLTSSGQQNVTSWATLTLKAGVPYHLPVITQLQLTSGTLLAFLWQPA